MDKKELILLAEKVACNKATDSQLAKYNSWFNSTRAGIDWEKEGLGSWEAKESVLFEKISSTISESKTKKHWILYMGAAAAVATIIFGLWLYLAPDFNNQVKMVTVRNDIGPGRQGATLLLSTGESIHLDANIKGEIANEAGVSIIKSASGELVYQLTNANSNSISSNTLITAMAET